MIIDSLSHSIDSFKLVHIKINNHTISQVYCKQIEWEKMGIKRTERMSRSSSSSFITWTIKLVINNIVVLNGQKIIYKAIKTKESRINRKIIINIPHSVFSYTRVYLSVIQVQEKMFLEQLWKATLNILRITLTFSDSWSPFSVLRSDKLQYT